MHSRIRKIRKSLKLTQSAFGERIGVKGNTITNYETELRQPTTAVIMAICREFNVNEEWLRNGGDDSQMFNPEPDTDQAVIERIAQEYSIGSPVFRALAETYLRLDEPHRKAFDEIVEQFVAEYNRASGSSAEPAPDANVPLKRIGTVHPGGKPLPLYETAPDADLYTRHAARQERRELAEEEAEEFSPVPGSRHPVLNDEP